MRMDKWILIGCITVTVISIAIVIFGSDNSILSNIGAGLLSGSIVSGITTILHYAFERKALGDEIRTSLRYLYIQLAVLKDITGTMLQSIPSIDNVSQLNISTLCDLASQCHSLASNCHTERFSGLAKNSRTASRITSYNEFINNLWNLKYCLNGAKLQELEAEKYELQIGLKMQQGYSITPDEAKLLSIYRDSIMIKISKIHEYEAALMNELNELCEEFFTNRHACWDNIKSELNHSVEMLVNEWMDSATR